MVCFRHGPGCGCSCTPHVVYHWYRGPNEFRGENTDRMEFIGNASEEAMNTRIAFPDAGSKYRLKLNEQNPFTEHATIIARVSWSSNIADGATLRLYFESDRAENNYQYADIRIIKFTLPGYVTVTIPVVELGERSSGTDTLRDSWSELTDTGDIVTPSLWTVGLTRQSCASGEPTGCADGYAAHIRDGRASGLLNTDDQPYASFNAYAQLSPIQDRDPLNENHDHPGASIETALSAPPDTYAGVARMDSLTGIFYIDYLQIGKRDLPSSLALAGSAKKCWLPDWSRHNVCREPNLYTIRVDIGTDSGETDGYTRYDGVSFPRDFARGATVSVPELGDDGITFTAAGTSDYVSYEVKARHMLRSTAAGETGWLSRGQNANVEEYLLVHLYALVDANTNSFQYFVWEVTDTVAGREIDCDGFDLTLDSADATITTAGPGPFPIASLSLRLRLIDYTP